MNETVIVRRAVADEQLAALPESLHGVLRRVYAGRGVTAEQVHTPLSALLPISELAGTAAAAERLAQAFRQGERLLIVGDFDADGATATALMMTCLRAFGFKDPHYLVPDRFRFGYGLSAPLVDSAEALQPDVIITVDNGISSIEGVAAAVSKGIDVIVTDHHLPGPELPQASVIVNPNAQDNPFPSKALAGVGVAFYVMAALGQRLAADGHIDATEARTICAGCLDLVALGTVADLVPMDFNNRVLVAQGLQRIRMGHSRPGLTALFAAAGRAATDATTGDLGFAIAPRLNAAGRLEDISIGIECLLATSGAEAEPKAVALSRLNEQRKALQASMQADADAHIDAALAGLTGAQMDAACLYDDSWHQGVVGLVATRIKDRINRPVIAFAASDDPSELKGSGRSVKGVHMRDLLAHLDATHPGLIGRFGGHAMAAGLSLPRTNLERFRELFALEVSLHTGSIDDDGTVVTDGALAPEELSLPVAELVRTAAPWGQGFPEPLFDGVFEVLSQRIVGGKHLKLMLRHRDATGRIDAIAFNQGEALQLNPGNQCHVAYRLDVNDFRGQRTPQLVVEHIECV